MAALALRLADATLDSAYGALLEADQTAANTSTGWKVAKTGAGASSAMSWGAAATTGFTTETTNPKPVAMGTSDTTALRTLDPYTGTFAATAWTLTFAVRATTASSQAGRIRVRVYTSPNSDGSGATERTGSTQVGTTSAALSTSADVTSVVTWTPGAAFDVDNEYIFVMVAWEITTASGSNNGNVLFRTGTSAAGTRIVTSNLSPLETATISSVTTPSSSEIYTPGGITYTDTNTPASKTTIILAIDRPIIRAYGISQGSSAGGTALMSDATLAQLLDTFSARGASAFRFDYNDDALRMAQFLQSRGMATKSICVIGTVADSPTYVAKCQAAVAALRPYGIVRYELGFEPNLHINTWPSIADYVTWNNNAYDAIKAIDSSLAVLNGGLGIYGQYGDSDATHQNMQNFFETAVPLGLEFDEVSCHPYFFGPSFTLADLTTTTNAFAGIPQALLLTHSIRATLVANGLSAKKIVFTEIGVPTTETGTSTWSTEEDQAGFIQWLLDYLQSHSEVGDIFYYDGVDHQVAGVWYENPFGLIYTTDQPDLATWREKPALAAWSIGIGGGEIYVPPDIYTDSATITSTTSITAPPTFPSTSLLDDFNRADGALGSDWGDNPQNTGFAPVISSNKAVKNPSGNGSALWKTSTFGPDCEVFGTVNGVGDASDFYLYARCSAGTNGNGYICDYFVGTGGTGLIRIYKKTGSTRTLLGTAYTVASPHAGDSFGMKLTGDTINAYYKPFGGSWALVKTVTDSTYSMANYIGMYIESTTGLDDFSGGTQMPVPIETAQIVDSSIIATITTPSSSEIYTTSGTAYTETATITSRTIPSAVEVVADVDANTITSHTTPSATEIAAFADSTIVGSVSTPSAVETVQRVDTTTIASVSIPSAVEAHTILDAGTVAGITSLTSTDILAAIDSATITNITTPISSGVDVTINVAADSFTRNNAIGSGWGIAEIGGTWTCYSVTGVSVAKFGVDGAHGQMKLDVANASRSAILTAVDVADVDIATRFQLDSTPTGAAITYYVLARIADISNHYRIRVNHTTTGTLTINISAVTTAGGTVDALGTSQLWGTAIPNTYYRVRFQAIGSLLRMRIWADGDPEPSTWDLSWTDSTIIASGGIGLRGLANTGNTNLPTILWDDLSAIAYVESDTIATISVPSSAEITQFADRATISGATTPLIVDTAQYVETATVSTIASLSAIEVQPTIVDIATASSMTTPIVTETAQFVDSVVINGITTFSANEVAAFVDSSIIRTMSTISSTELHEISDAATSRSITSLVSADIAAYIESAIVASATTPDAIETHLLFDSATIISITVPISVDIAAYIDASTIIGITTPGATEEHVLLDAVAVQSTTSLTVTEIAAYLDTAVVVITTQIGTAELHTIVDSAIVLSITAIASADIAQFIDANTIGNVTAIVSLEQLPGTDTATVQSITALIAPEIAAFIDAATIFSATVPLAFEERAISDTAVTTSITTLTAADIAQFTDDATLATITALIAVEAHDIPDTALVTGITTPSSSDIATYVDAFTTSSFTTITFVEGLMHVDTDSATTVTTPSSSDVAGYVDTASIAGHTEISTSDVFFRPGTDAATAISKTTPTSTDLAAFIDSASLATQTSLSAVELILHGVTDSATVESSTLLLPVEVFQGLDRGVANTVTSLISTEALTYADLATITSKTYVSTFFGLILNIELVAVGLRRWNITATSTATQLVLRSYKRLFQNASVPYLLRAWKAKSND